MSFAGVYPHYVAKAEKKGRTREELDALIFLVDRLQCSGPGADIGDKTDFETFSLRHPDECECSQNYRGDLWL